MIQLVEKKIEELKAQLSHQGFTAQDEAEIEKAVQEYRQELIEAKKDEYAYNQEMIKAQINVLEELKNEEIKEEENKVVATAEEKVETAEVIDKPLI